MQFIDLHAQYKIISENVQREFDAIMNASQFIMGPHVKAFEDKLAEYCGATYALSCANGTDALALPLMAWGIGPGDAVFCPSFTFAATAEVVPWLGAVPVFVDIDSQTFNISTVELEASIEAVMKEGKLNPKVIIAVDLFGQPADYAKLRELANKYNLKLIADSAQGFGCTIGGEHPIKWADIVTTSFFPAKPLGCYGDGGAILMNDSALSEVIDSLRVHGKATAAEIAKYSGDATEAKYLNFRIGMNSRLDTLQAAVLIEKLKIFPGEISARQRCADFYSEKLSPIVQSTPFIKEGYQSVWAQYTIEVEDRARVIAKMKGEGIPSAIYYPVPIHAQIPYQRYREFHGPMDVTNDKASRVLSLPMHPYLTEEDQEKVVRCIAAAHDV